MGKWENDESIEAEKGGGFEPLPIGRYRFVVEECEPKVWPSGDVFWKLKLQPIEPVGINRHAKFDLNFPALVNSTMTPDEQAKQLRRIKDSKWDMKCLGIDPKVIDKDDDAGTIVGRTVCADVEHRTFKDKKTGADRTTEQIWHLDPDSGVGTVDTSKPISKGEAESVIPF